MFANGRDNLETRGKSPETKAKAAGVNTLVIWYLNSRTMSSPQVRARPNIPSSPIANDESAPLISNTSKKSSSMEGISQPLHTQYRFMFPLTLVLLLLQTLIWRRYQDLFCGTLCAAT